MFSEILKEELIRESDNYYTDNYDYLAHVSKIPFKKKLINAGKRVFYSRSVLSPLLKSNSLYRNFFLGKLYDIDRYMEPLEYFYSNLEDDESKQLLVKLVAFRILGYVKVKLPLSNSQYWSDIKKVESLKDHQRSITLNYPPWKLYLHDLTSVGIPVKMYLDSKALFTTFCLEQYEKDVAGIRIGASEGDTVLDLGGCYGDTALYFSNKVGPGGKVYSFEFIPGNLKIMNSNLDLNPGLKSSIEIIKNPVWNESNLDMYFRDYGAGSQVSFKKFEGQEGVVSTLAVDDFVKQYKLEKVDFIKSDIEGAEPYMLDGAVQTIKRFAPKLAISIYHNMDDFTGIIRKIKQLNSKYRFYLGHSTIYTSETVLFAIA